MKFKFRAKKKTIIPPPERKNSYLLERDRDSLVAKKETTISKGFNFIMIIEKNYKEFESLYLS